MMRERIGRLFRGSRHAVAGSRTRAVRDRPERPDDCRAAFLDSACSDPDLRHEVDALLAADAGVGDFLAAPAALPGSSSGEESVTLLLPRRCLRCGARYDASCAECSHDGSDLVEDPAALINTTLDGTYDVLRLIGQGGMGEVYLANDTTLGRRVALKVLPPSVSRDQLRLRRFEQEARAAAKLSHPNVCMVYELGSADDGRRFIAMEYVDGRTLRSRIADGPLPLDEALGVARQIARALAAAHEAGVVHRDAKPENVMLRSDGLVKVLDFGLAKLAEAPALLDDGGAFGGARGEMATRGVVGTLGYMSPEQATGRPVDARSDVFSFGAVLYELLTGERAFAGATAAETVYATVHGEPAKLGSLEGAVPAGLAEVVRRCLEKAPEQRYESGAALAAALDEQAESLRSSGATAIAPDVAPAPRLWRWSLALTVALMLAVGGAWVWRANSLAGSESRAASGPPLGPMKISRLTSVQGVASFPKFSPDGMQVAFGAEAEGYGSKAHVYIKNLDNGTERRLTPDASRDLAVSWSPDGHTIAFLRTLEGKQAVMTMPVDGGPERLLVTTNHYVSWETTDWSPNGDLIAYSDFAEPDAPWGIYLVDVATLETRQLTFPPGIHFAAAGDWSPAFSPDGKSVAFARGAGPMVADLYVVAVAGGEPRRLTFDNKHIMGVAWTPDGSSIVFGSARGGAMSLWRIAPEGGEPEPLGVGGSPAMFPAISRDGTRLAYTTGRSESTTWRIDLPERHGRLGPPAPLATATGFDRGMQYSPDGKRLAFASNRSGASRLWVCDGDGSNAAQVPGVDHPVFFRPVWSSDGRFLAYVTALEGNYDVYVVAAEGGTPRRLTDDGDVDLPRAWSHDGRWIYVVSGRSGSLQLWKMSPEGGEAVQLTRDGATAALDPLSIRSIGVRLLLDGSTSVFESRDGRHVYHHKPGGPGLWRIPVEGGEEELVWDEAGADLGGWWVLADDGVYFVTRMEDHAVIELYSFATRRRTSVASAPMMDGLTISPDGRRLLYWTLDRLEYNIFLAENVRL